MQKKIWTAVWTIHGYNSSKSFKFFACWKKNLAENSVSKNAKFGTKCPSILRKIKAKLEFRTFVSFLLKLCSRLFRKFQQGCCFPSIPTTPLDVLFIPLLRKIKRNNTAIVFQILLLHLQKCLRATETAQIKARINENWWWISPKKLWP